MNFLLKALAALTLLASATTASNSSYVKAVFPEHCGTIPNKDRPGDDLISIAGVSDACSMYCTKTTGCAAFVWFDGVCYLKTRVGALVDKPGVVAFDCVDKAAESTCAEYKDIDFVGNDIGNKPAKSYGECCNICSGFKGCTAYAWNAANGGTCWLKSSVGHVVANVGVSSSSTVKLWGPVCPFEYNVDFEGNDIGNVPAGDAGVCCSKCKANAACKAYSWNNHNGGTCWMKNGKGKTIAKSGAISAKLAGF